MARWKARVDFLLTVIESLFLSLTVDALQGKTCQNSLIFGGGGSIWAKISGEGVISGEYVLISRKLDTFCYLTVQIAPCYVQSFWHNTGMWQTDRQTDGIAMASTALAMRALWRAVKMGVVLIKHRSEGHWAILLGYLTISTNVRLTTLSFSRTVHPVHLAFNTVQLLQCRTLNFLSPELWPHNCPELTPLTVRVRESYTSMSMSCK